MIQCQMEDDMQDAGGLNSVMQAMAKAGFFCKKHSLHSDRLRVKFGDGITTAECCDLHHQVVRYQNTTEYASWFSRANLRAAPQEVMSHTTSQPCTENPADRDVECGIIQGHPC